ncbi:hypothetical protein [Kistimonas asteriae]|uniref:hypothetical protein n=1 Tax=Kistimonas asteriae TaxID=517724 RepID=UPI001BACF3C3|nr:hypothetical protein [Kistimonas asteriae]
MMPDWIVSNFEDDSLNESWVYYKNKNYAEIHFSRSIDEPVRDHMATDDRKFYYFGHTKTFNRDDVPSNIINRLVNAWDDYFTVR